MAGYDINSIIGGLSPEERNELMWSSMSGGLAQIAPLLGRRDAGIGTLLAAFGAGMGGARQQALGDIEGRKYRQSRMQAEQMQLEAQQRDLAEKEAAKQQIAAYRASLTPDKQAEFDTFTNAPAEFAKRQFPDAIKPSSNIAQLASDFKNGLIDEGTYKAALRKETHITPTAPREDPLVPVRMPDGTSQYVPRSQAVGMQVGSSADQGGGTGPFEGNGLDQQMLNKVLAGQEKIRQGIPMGPQEQAVYEAARAHLMAPRQTIDQSTGQLITTTPPYKFPEVPAAAAAGAPAAAVPQAAIGAPGMAAPAGMPNVTQIAPNMTVTDVAGTRDQRKKFDEMTSAYNDMSVITSSLKNIIGSGIDPTNQEQVGKFNSARGDLMAALAKAQERGVLQPGEADQMMETLGDLTSWTAAIRNKTGILDPVPRFTGFIDQQQATMADRLLNRASEFGVSADEVNTKLRQPIKPGGGGGGAQRPKVSTPEEAAQLPPGTEYETPDGQVFRR